MRAWGAKRSVGAIYGEADDLLVEWPVDRMQSAAQTAWPATVASATNTNPICRPARLPKWFDNFSASELPTLSHSGKHV